MIFLSGQSVIPPTAWLSLLFVAGVEGSQKHWAFQAITAPEPPAVRDRNWPSKPLDHFVLNQFEAEGRKPATPAPREVLIRRVYFDLIGLPPTPTQIRAFIEDRSPNAFAKVVDSLLKSKHYGERWGRHWLDVARYGDSNGSDENHAYPHAWRYRNWVIDAFNRDLPFDEFVRDQLAGDLIAPADPDRITATGFLAIGTKILAEKDSVKKKADIVDEQLDTIGRAFLGLSIGCARCHDHKFDPISARDYYAMAGIFHSMTIHDSTLTGPRFDAETADLRAKVDGISKQIASLGKKLASGTQLEWEAETFSRGHASILHQGYGQDIGIIGDKGKGENWAEYDAQITEPGVYLMEIRYAAKTARPGQILIDGKVAATNALSETSGGWYPENQRWFIEGQVRLSEGPHALRIQSQPLMAHIDKLRLTKVKTAKEGVRVVKQLGDLKQQRMAVNEELAKMKPSTMAVMDGKTRNSKIHLRGDPHDEGDLVPRGFLAGIGAGAGDSPRNGSGRRQLAAWLTSPKNPLTARVIANRIWHWHFSNGLVSTPDNFGVTGAAPSNRDLLDHLATELIRDNWSIKSLHRKILLSNTYRMGSDPEVGFALRRLDAEEFRDAVLHASGSLDLARPTGSSLYIISAKLTHVTLGRNRRAYDRHNYRSVYLPIVRNNIYDLFTLLDFPNGFTPVGQRANTTVPTQALMMMNSPWIMKQSRLIAESVRATNDPLNELHLRLFARPIAKEERTDAKAFLHAASKRKNLDHAWGLLCQTLLSSNEFLYVR